MTIHMRLLMAIVVALALGAPVYAQHTVYKWVDKDGTVHFGDEPPSKSEVVSVEEIVLPDSSVSPQSSPQQGRLGVKPPKQERERTVAPRSKAITLPADVDRELLSQEELDRRCEAEREAKIAPLREMEIEKCIHEQQKDPDYCRRFFADYGEGGRTVFGGFRPRMFHDLPVCLDAEKRRHGRQ